MQALAYDAAVPSCTEMLWLSHIAQKGFQNREVLFYMNSVYEEGQCN